MIEYVVGFLFSTEGLGVAMVRKNKPEWQRGLLNGIGGKIEEGETPLAAMHREFKEEAGVEGVDWQERLVLTSEVFSLHVFSAFDHEKYLEVQTMEAEEIVRMQVNNLNTHQDFRTIDNLQWLIPLLLDRHSRQKFMGTLSY